MTQLFRATYRFLAYCFYLLPNCVTKHKQYIKACISGVISLGLQLIVFNALRLFIKPTWANTIAVECAIITNFIINYHFTFRANKKNQPSCQYIIKQFVQFNLLSLSSMLIQFISLHLELRLLGRHLIYENMAVLIGIVIGSVVNFIFYKTIIWRD